MMEQGRLDPRRLLVHSHCLIALWIDRDGANILALQFLNWGHARAFVFDHEFTSGTGVAPVAMYREDFALKIGIFKPLTV